MTKESVFYTINNKLQFFYTSGQLVLNHQQVKLDPLESTVFQKLVEHPKQIIHNDDLLNLWPTSTTSPNSLTRVISTLRKKLRELGVEEVEIKNYPKKGYTLLAEVKLDEPVVNSVELSNEGLDNQQPSSFANFIALGALVAAVIVIYAIYPTSLRENRDIPPVLAKAIQLIDDKYEKIDLTPNNDLKQLAYAMRDSINSPWKLIVLDTYSLKKRIISVPQMNLRTPDWLDAKSIVFRAYNDTECAIQKLDLSRSDAEPISLFPCNKLTTGKGLSVINSETVLFTDAPLDIAPASIYRGDVNTGKVTRITTFETMGVGSYGIQSTPNSDLVAVLAGPDWKSTHIHLLDPNREWQSIWKTETPRHKYSVSWDGNALIHANDKGGVTANLFNHDSFTRSIQMSGFSKLYNLVGNNGSVAFLQGNIYRTDVLIAPIDDKQINASLLVDSRASNKLAQFINVNEVLYISDITGIEQLWLVDIRSQIKRQISTFTDAQRIEKIAFNRQQNLIAVEAGHRISLYRLSENKVDSMPFHSISGSKPLIVGDQLLFVQQDEYDNYNIHALNLQNHKVQRNLIVGANEAKISDGQLYYTKFYQPGLWRYNKSSKDELVSSMSQDTNYWFIDGNNLIYKNPKQPIYLEKLSSNHVKTIEQSACYKITDFKYGQCLGTQLKANNTQLLIAESFSHTH